MGTLHIQRISDSVTATRVASYKKSCQEEEEKMTTIKRYSEVFKRKVIQGINNRILS